MSRSRLGVSAALLFAMAAFAGGQEPKKDPPKTEPPKVDPKKEPPKEPPKVDPKVDPKAQPPVPGGKTFAFAFTKDKKFYSEVSTTVKQFVKVQGQDLTQNQESTFWYEWTPTDQKDGKWTVRQRVEGLKMTIDISGNTINYDSTKPENPAAGNPGLNDFFKKLGTAEFTATIDKNYRVEKVEGRDKFISEVTGGSPQLDALLKKVLTDDALKDMTDPTLKMVPDSPKKAGDTWERKAPLNLGPIGTYEATYKFKYVGPATEADKKDMDKIEVEATLNYTAPKDDPAAGGLLFRIKGGTLTNDPAGTPAKGTIWYDTKAQRPGSADMNLKLKGKLTVTIGGTDTEVELSMEQKTAVKYSDSSLKPAAAKTP